ncbi:anti-repressor SinI family protein [Neobacillus sp. PS3-40]|nr:anti-repressor SinI family protein [Neobacillus sp. PS3-40]WML46457.1 anti-repressor SinI family protein [Neobacillus sp. PS3-40]
MTKTVEDMDVEWMALILEAKKLGITKETIRDFLDQKGVNNFFIENR